MFHDTLDTLVFIAVRAFQSFSDVLTGSCKDKKGSYTICSRDVHDMFDMFDMFV
jgi:hypothetical protein